jgi:hypothetical protein
LIQPFYKAGNKLMEKKKLGEFSQLGNLLFLEDEKNTIFW